MAGRYSTALRRPGESLMSRKTGRLESTGITVGAQWRRRCAFAVALSLAAATPALAAPPDASGGPAQKGKAQKEDLPPIPEGVPTSRATAFLPSVSEMKAGRE